MSIIIGLTGGIGSGKTTIANYYKSLGIPVYTADNEAKNLYTDPNVLVQLTAIFDDSIITNKQLDKKKLAALVFNNPSALQKLNNLIHPLVKLHFENWIQLHKEFPVLIKESALLFETNAYKNCDYTITVTAPEQEKINRVQLRDHCSKSEVEARMKNQLSDAMKIEKSDFVINNISINSALQQADTIIKKIKNFIIN